MPIADLLLINFATVALLMLVLWRYAVAIRDVSFIDAVWAYGMVVVAIVTFAYADGDATRKLVLLGLVSLWGLRLGTHLLIRWRAAGVDPRYAVILKTATEKRGMSYARASFQKVFALQTVLLFIVCLPVQLGQLGTTPFGIIGVAGAIIALFGIAFETIGDSQLKRHRNNPEMKGKVLETGLWRYTRHPNYFGDCCTWWGIWIVAAETMPGLWSIPGPILLTWLLTRLSGVPMLEYSLKKTKPGYADYIARTSGFLPLPPKKS